MDQRDFPFNCNDGTITELGMAQKVSKFETPDLTDLRAIRTREALRTALLALLEEKPLEQILVRDITKAARTGYATFYRHYPTKEALLEDLAKQQVKHLVEISLPVMDGVNILAAYKTLFAQVDEHRDIWKTLLNSGASDAIKLELLQVSREVAITRAETNNSAALELRVILVVTCTVELLAWWLNQPNQMTVDEVAQILDSTVIVPFLQYNKS